MAEKINGIGSDWITAQRLRGPSMKDEPAFYRNLEELLDTRRASHTLGPLRKPKGTIDFSSNDFLSLSSSGLLRQAFLDELARHPDFNVGATGSRLADGNLRYMEVLEAEIAAFHGGDRALVVNSGYDGNCAIYSAIPRPGDVVVFDELIHASVHDGMKACLAEKQLQFRHNDVDSLEEVLVSLRESNPLIRSGSRCVLIGVESVYSMDGDVCPLQEMVDVAKEIFPHGNAQFIVDEAHSTGIIGENGRGLVCALGLEKKIAIRLHTYGKAMAATGGAALSPRLRIYIYIFFMLTDSPFPPAAILSNDTVRNVLLNFARPVIFTTAPSFPMLATIRAAYGLMNTGMTEEVSAPRPFFIFILFSFYFWQNTGLTRTSRENACCTSSSSS